MNEFDKQIINNLRETYGINVADFSDEQIIKTYNVWTMSDKSEEFLIWLEDEKS